MIRLPVSVGEAVDKLTILDIKCRKISDPEKLAHCIVERDALRNELGQYVSDHPFYYRLLYHINNEIWTIQDAFRQAPTAEACVQILDKNDMRFRIKSLLNNLTNSHLREQKGYPKRRAFVLHHLGLGDHVCMVGAVRYIALQHDETVVVCKKANARNVAALFADDPSIKLEILGEVFSYDTTGYTNVYISGEHAGIYHNWGDFPMCFYDDMKMDRSIRYTYFHVPDTPASHVLYTHVKDIPYNFVHQTFAGNGGGVIRSMVTWDINDVFTIEPNINLYPEGHPWHALAETFVDRPFLDYSEIIRHAKEVHVVNSSFYCLAAHLDLDASVARCYSRYTGEYDPTWSFKPTDRTAPSLPPA